MIYHMTPSSQIVQVECYSATDIPSDSTFALAFVGYRVP